MNKQYSQNEYESLLPQIIGEMTKAGEFGEFFPGHLSPFGYNETIAMEYYPLPKAEAEKKVYRWSDYEPDKPNVKHSILASQLPDSVTPIANEILEWAIICEKSEKPFRIVEKELSFYRKHDLPLPKYHPDERHRRRLLRRNPRQLWQRECAQCCRSIMTTYAPERPERVLCEDCYRQIVF